MALDDQQRVTPAATVGDAYKLLSLLLIPYVVLTFLFTAPNQIAVALGFYADLNAYTARIEAEPSADALSGLPVGDLLVALVLGFVTLSGFGIFWYRYLLLGPRSALRFTPAELGTMLWRFCRYGVTYMLLWLGALIVATLLGCFLGGLVCSLLGQSGNPLAILVIGGTLFLAYIWPLSMAMRTSLIFPAIALGDELTLRQSWAMTRNSSSGLFWSVILAGVPALALSYGLHSGLSAIFGVDLLIQDTATIQSYWWLLLLISPVANLALALCLVVVAVAYSDLAEVREAFQSTEAAELAH